MAIRVTQQYLEYLADATSESDVRVTKVFAQVLGEFAVVDTAEDTLNITEVAVEGIFGPSSDTLTFSETASAGVSVGETASDTLTIAEEAILDLARGADTLTITEVASAAESEYNVSASDTLTITESGSVIMFASDSLTITEQADHRDVSEDTLSFAETVTTISVYNTEVGDTLSVTEAVATIADFCTFTTDDMDEFEDVYDPVTNTVTSVQTGGFRDEATIAGPVFGDSSDILVYVEGPQGWDVPPDGVTSFTEAASDTLTITEKAANSYVDDASDTLSITETADADVSVNAEDTLTITEEASATMDYGAAAATDTLAITEGVGAVIEEDDTECTYTPFIGTDTDPDAPAPPPKAYSPAKESTGFKLQYPGTGPITDEVVLRNPEFGNRERLDISRVLHETRGGTLIVYRDPIWPKIHTLLFTFTALSEAQKDALLVFMEAYPGLDIRVIDHEGREWVGIITNPNEPVVQDGRGKAYTASLEFRGERTDTLGADDTLDITDTNIGEI